MTKQKNDGLATQHKRIKQFVGVVILLGVMALSTGIAVLSSRARSYDLDAIAEYISFPKEARIFESFCIAVGGIGDRRLATGFLSSDLWESEIYMDGVKISLDQFDAIFLKSLPGAMRWCYPYGLDRGAHTMMFKLVDSVAGEIGSYEWILTVDQEVWSDKTVRSKIAQLTTQEQYMPQHAERLYSITREAMAHTPICISEKIAVEAFAYQNYMNNYERWSEIRINGVKVSPGKITITPNSALSLLSLCLDEGLNAGQYVAHVTIKSVETDRYPQLIDLSYDWVLSVQPGEMQDRGGYEH